MQESAFALEILAGRCPTYSGQQAEDLSCPAFASPLTDHDATDGAECGKRYKRQSEGHQEGLQTIYIEFEEWLIGDCSHGHGCCARLYRRRG